MSTADVSVFNVQPSEESGSIVNLVGAEVKAQASAVSAQQQSNPIDVDVTGAEIQAKAGSVIQWPMNGWAMTGGYQISDFSQNQQTEPFKTDNATKDIYIGQGRGWSSSQLDDLTSDYSTFKGLNPNLKIIYYFQANAVRKVNPNGTGLRQDLYDLMNSATRGTSQWFLKDPSGNKVQSLFSDLNYRINNYCVQFQDNNSLGRTFDVQFLTELFDGMNASRPAGKMLDFTDGVFFDVVAPSAQKVIIDGTTSTSAQDFDNDGNADGRFDETDGAGVEADYGGARMHRRGSATWITTFESIFPASQVMLRNGTRDGLDYVAGDLTDPWIDSEFYQKWAGGIQERIGGSIGIKPDGPDYRINFNGFDTFCRRQQMIKLAFLPEADHPWGPFGSHCVLTDTLAVDRTPIDIDYEFADYIGGLVALNGTCLAMQRSKRRSFPTTDAYRYLWGAPIASDHPNIGTLDINTIGNPWVLRSPDFIIGGARFYWVLFANVAWIVRTDYTGNGSTFGSGATVNCEVPDPGANNKWIYPDLSNYTHPTSGYTTRNQRPSVYNGSDIPTGGSFGVVPLGPPGGVMIARVSA